MIVLKTDLLAYQQTSSKIGGTAHTPLLLFNQLHPTGSTNGFLSSMQGQSLISSRKLIDIGLGDRYSDRS